MFWIAFYLGVATAIALIALLLAGWSRSPGAPTPEHPGAFAVLAGLLWPAVVVGLIQWGLIAALATPQRSANLVRARFEEFRLTSASH